MRICRRCREINSREALVCGKCGSSELSETSGPLPSWMVLLKFFPGVLIFVFITAIIRHPGFLLSLLIVIGFFYLVFLCIPPEGRKVLKWVFRHLRILIMGKRKMK